MRFFSRQGLLQNRAKGVAQLMTMLIEDLQDDIKAMIYLQLMNIHGTRNNTKKVKELYQKAKKLNNVTQPQVKDNIEQVGLMLQGKHSQQKKMMGKKAQRSMMNQGYMRRGRRRK